MQSIVFILVFLSTLFLFLGLYLLWKSRRSVSADHVLERIAPQETEETRLSALRMSRMKPGGWVEFVCSPFLRLDALPPLLQSAGVSLSPTTFLLLPLVCGALTFALGLAITSSVPLALVVSLLGVSTPFAYLTIRRKKTERKLVRQFPEALEFMVRALRAGQSLDRAMQGVVSNFTDPIAGQIRSIYDEISLGLPFSEAFRRFEARFPSLAEVKILSTALIVHRETGGNLVRVLEVLSDNIRQRVRLASQLKASTAEVRVTAVILGLLPVGLLGVFNLLNPDYIRVLFVHPLGRKMLVFACILELVGFAVMRSMTRLEA